MKLLAILMAASLAATALADEPDVLPGTRRWVGDTDPASDMVAGIDRFLLRKTEESTARREAKWKLDTSSPEAHARSIAPQRERLAHILGVRDPRIPATAREALDTEKVRGGTLVAEAPSFSVQEVNWPAFGDVRGECLLLVPIGLGPATVAVVAVPDSTRTPEQIVGLAPGVAPESQFARRLAESGCLVLVPGLVDRGVTHRKLSNREFLYRSAFELGRHVIGYDIQQVLAGVDRLGRRRIGVIGWGDGGMVALEAAALDTRIDAACVSGHFGDRRGTWSEPIDRNVFGLLERFGDAHLAALIAPRTLIVEACRAPAVVVPAGTGAGPGKLATPKLEAVRDEVERARKDVGPLKSDVRLIVSGDGAGPPGSAEALTAFLQALAPGKTLAPLGQPPTAIGEPTDPADRSRRRVHELDRHNQQLLDASAEVRRAFMGKLDTSSLDAHARTVEPYRKLFEEEVIGKFDDPMLPPDAKSRKLFEGPKYTGYEVAMDVFPDVFACGIMIVPKGIATGEKRPVVVCQHGLEGRPRDVADPGIDSPYYHQFAVRLAERGFITFSPQNPYIFEDRFRTIQRKANPLGKTLFSIIVPQHRQILAWLKAQPFVDGRRIGFYGLSYGGKTAMRVPALVTDYALSICSADFNEWVWKNASTHSKYSYVWTGEYEIFEFDLGGTFNYAEMAALIAPRPFMVERGHFDDVAPDEMVAFEFAKVRRLYNGLLKVGDRAEIEFFDGPHTIRGEGTFRFLHKHLDWPEPAR